jgi:hypothetical protein
MSRPTQNLGGSGLNSSSKAAATGGEVNGRGTDPPKSVVEQDTPNRIHAAAASNMVMFFITL